MVDQMIRKTNKASTPLISTGWGTLKRTLEEPVHKLNPLLLKLDRRDLSSEAARNSPADAHNQTTPYNTTTSGVGTVAACRVMMPHSSVDFCLRMLWIFNIIITARLIVEMK